MIRSVQEQACRSKSVALAVMWAIVPMLGMTHVSTAQERTAAERMQAPGPEGALLARRAGTWAVTSTVQLAPDAKPIVTKGLTAERTMVGLYLQEVMHPGPGSAAAEFRRIAYQYYDRVGGRWQYVSMDTRFPVGIMPARTFGPEDGHVLRFEFDDIAFVGLGTEVEGRTLHSNLIVDRQSDTHEIVQQYMIAADGTGRQWLAVIYDYTRER